ncbi:MAG: inorganic diphosphatase [Anaerolineales bacterium]
MIRTLIQVVPGSSFRNVYNEKTLEIPGKRPASDSYPYSYGFIIGTLTDDDDAVDCYLITKEKLKPGSIVDCEPFGMLEQFEGDELDHKVLAVLPGQQAEITLELQKELKDFIHTLFRYLPDIQIRVGDILPKEDSSPHSNPSDQVNANGRV